MLRTSLSILILLYAAAAAAQDSESATSKPPKLFKESSQLAITLTAPWRKLMRNKSSEDRHEGTLTYTDANGQERTINVGITTRGLTRRDKVCDFPPLKLWFEKSENKGTEFRGQSSLKMVTHCEKSSRYEQLYIKEFLAYRIYNLITPYSFRVRALQVAYQEEGSSRKPDVRFGFLIEDIDDLADRLDLKELDIEELEPGELDAEQLANYSLFQYLIANLDWAATAGPQGEHCCHNGKLIGAGPDERPVYVIPYDFDSSGLVDAPYAAPPTRLGVRSVTDRLYRGFCSHNAAIPAALERFRSHREEIIGLVETNDLLDIKESKETVRFLEAFYTSLETDADVQKQLIDKCRG